METNILCRAIAPIKSIAYDFRYITIKILIYPIFYLFKGDYRRTQSVESGTGLGPRTCSGHLRPQERTMWRPSGVCNGYLLHICNPFWLAMDPEGSLPGGPPSLALAFSNLLMMWAT